MSAIDVNPVSGPAGCVIVEPVQLEHVQDELCPGLRIGLGGCSTIGASSLVGKRVEDIARIAGPVVRESAGGRGGWEWVWEAAESLTVGGSDASGMALMLMVWRWIFKKSKVKS